MLGFLLYSNLFTLAAKLALYFADCLVFSKLIGKQGKGSWQLAGATASDSLMLQR